MSTSIWSPWITGVVLAFLFLISLYVLDAPVGSNAAYSTLIDKGKEAINGMTPTLDWQVLFLIGASQI